MEQTWEDELRLLLADARRQAHREAPTLGRLFADTPGVPSRDDDTPDTDVAPPLRVMTLEEWERSWP